MKLQIIFFSTYFPKESSIHFHAALRAGPMEDEEGEDGEDGEEGEEGEEGLDPCSLEAAQSPVPRRVRLTED